MKFYSEELKQFFDSEQECLEREEEARKKKESAKSVKAKFAKAVEDADESLSAAYEDLESAKNKVAELQKEYDEKVDAIMKPATDAVKKCTQARFDAIEEFNKRYGTYTTTYTGNKALNELCKTLDFIDTIFDNKFWY